MINRFIKLKAPFLNQRVENEKANAADFYVYLGRWQYFLIPETAAPAA